MREQESVVRMLAEVVSLTLAMCTLALWASLLPELLR